MSTFEEAKKGVDMGKRVYRECWYGWLSIIRVGKSFKVIGEDSNGRRLIGGLKPNEKAALDWVIE